MNPAWLPFAVTCTVLYLCLGLLPFVPSGISLGDVLALLAERRFRNGVEVLHLLLTMPLGFFWLGAVWPRRASLRVASTTLVFLGLGLIALLQLLAQVYFIPGLATPSGLPSPFLGFTAGMVLWWLVGPSMSHWGGGQPTWLWPSMVVLASLGVMVPLAIDTPLGEMALADGLSNYVSDIPQRLYLLIKGAILWAPLGFMFVLAGYGSALPRWGLALVVAWGLEGLPVLWGQPLQEVLEPCFALLGLWAGAWLAERTQPGPEGDAPAAVADTAAGGATMEAVGAASAPAFASRRSRRHGAQGRSAGGVQVEGMDEAVPPSDMKLAEQQAHAGRGRTGWHPASIALGFCLLTLALLGVVNFSRWHWTIGLGLALYAGVLWRWPWAWLVVGPAALPLLDLAPWTGRFFLDEFDLVMLVTAGMLFLRGSHGRPRSLLPGAAVLMTLFGISVLVSLFAGLMSMPAMDANAFSSYWSPYNSLRIAKGMAWGGLIFLWVRHSGLDMDVLGRRMAVGMGVGLLGVGLVGVWEHWLFDSQANGTYRIFSTFSSMHTGGGHIEAYLAAAVPFLWLYMGRWRDLAFSGPLLLLTALVMLYTVARGGLLALGVVVVILAIGSIRLAGARRAIMPVALMLTVAMVLGIGAGGGYLQQRLAQTGQDWQIRVDHWALALGLRDDSAMTSLFGMGLGSFPRAYLQRGPVEKQSGTYAFAQEGDNTFLRLGGGDTLYYAQRVDVKGGQGYRLEFDARADGAAARIDAPVCEKQMLNSRQCVWMSFDVPGDSQWHRLSRSFSSGEVGAEPAWRRPPVEMFLYMPVKGGVLAVDNLHLIGPDGRDLLCNGDFDQGGDCWFFKTHSHLPWHIKNLWVHVLFEQGWVGLLLLTSLIGLALYRLGKAGWRGHRLAWVWLASLAGMLTVGMFDSLLDAPRLATLLLAWTFLGASKNWEPRPSRNRRNARE